MLQIIYIVLSTIVMGLFSLIMNTAMGQYEQMAQDQIAYEEETSESAEEMIDEPLDVAIADQVVYEPVTQFGSESYVVEPANEEGMYTMENVPYEPMSTVDELNQAVNEFRVAHGQGPLEIDGNLCAFAAFRAEEIEGGFFHDGFGRYIDEGKADGYGFTHYGENIWTGSMMGVHIVEYGWAKSPGHYAALVGDWTKGCGGINNLNAVFIFAR